MQVDPRLDEIDDCLYRVAVKAIIVEQGKILIVQETGDEWWGLPGGGIDHGEDLPTALKRELQEEIGISGEDVKTDYKIAFAAVGDLLNGIPRINLYYLVSVPKNNITTTDHVSANKWVTGEELVNANLSPSFKSDAVKKVLTYL